MFSFTTPQAESRTPILVRILSCLLFRLQCSQLCSTNTAIPGHLRKTPSNVFSVITRPEDNAPSAILQCGAPSQTLEPLPSTAVPAIRILCRVFSTSNLAQQTPEIYPPRVLRGFYLGARTRWMLRDLSGPQFSAMIALFGTLSVPDPPSQFKSPLAQHMAKRDPRAWWGLIIQMVRDKQRVTGILKECDLYWLMRAKASKASLNDLTVYAGDGGGFPIYLARVRLINMWIQTPFSLLHGSSTSP
jgi:hypothetical protein